MVFKNTILHKKREKDFDEKEQSMLRDSMTKEELFESVIKNSSSYIHLVAEIVTNCGDSIENSDLKNS